MVLEGLERLSVRAVVLAVFFVAIALLLHFLLDFYDLARFLRVCPLPGTDHVWHS